MLKFYYNPISANARRVWVTLLEKQIPFEPILVNLDGDHLSEDFTAINPLQQIPVVIDNGFRIVESLAILDYLEAKYPTPSLMPNEINAIATVRMVEMIAVNELQPLMIPLMKQLVGLEIKPDKIDNARQRIVKIIQFYENNLARQSYFVNNQITLADIVAGTLVPSLPQFGLSLDNYPSLKTWSQQLEQRESWQQTSVKPEMIEAAIPNMRAILEKR
ncbi:glutathione S-transferase family protein [Coleofasciculus sp. E2-BRE-01]|uniref:glutathione S-transferase family protein n=1 Tax=Coleofasciculus sp. E2-BRE-01 TaxID=3069524 RepID=UPI0032FA75D3